MLDQFFEVALSQKERADARQEMVDAFMHFPDKELHKIACGAVKLADYDEGDWLEKFEGTPLYDQALELEEQKLQLDIQDQQQRLAENQERRAKNEQRDSIWDAQDAIRLKKRLLELELRKGQLGGGGGGEEEEEGEEESEENEAPTAPGEEAPEKMASAAVEELFRRRMDSVRMMGGILKQAAARKMAASWAETSPYFVGHSLLNPLPGSGYGAAAGGLMADPESQNPVARGALAGGLTGGAIYGLKGLKFSGDPRVAGLTALIGGTGGAIGGAHTSHALTQKAKERARKEAPETAKESMAKVAHGALQKVAAGHAASLTSLERHTIGEMAKAAKARMASGVPYERLESFEKVALGGIGAVAKGLWNAAKAGFGGKGLAKQVGAKGLGGAWQAGKGYLTAAAKKNPMAVAGLAGVAGLGAGALGGGLLGRMTAPQGPQY